MAGVGAIHSVGESVVNFLTSSYPQDLRDRFGFNPVFEHVSSGNFSDDASAINDKTVTVYLYRVTFNEQMRTSRGGGGTTPPLSLELHYLVTVWAEEASTEQRLMAWTMRQLHENPILDASALTSDGEWGESDIIHLVPAELSTEDLMRIWDTLGPTYRLSHSYVARVVQIDSDTVADPQRVVARRTVIGHGTGDRDE